MCVSCVMLVFCVSCGDSDCLPVEVDNGLMGPSHGDCEVCIEVALPSTRTEVVAHGLGLKTKWSAGDEILVVYNDNAQNKCLTLTVEEDDIYGNGDIALFKSHGGVSSEDWNCIRLGFRGAIVKDGHDDSCVKFNSSSLKLSVDYSNQSGRLEDVRRYDILFAGADDFGVAKDGKSFNLSFHHTLNNVIHIPLSTSRGGEIRKIFCGFTPGQEFYKNDLSKHSCGGNIFFGGYSTDNWLETFSGDVIETPGGLIQHLGGRKSFINYLRILDTHVDIRDKKADIYLISPAQSMHGRLCVQLLTESNDVLLNSFILLSDNDCSDSKVVVTKRCNFESDNAMGMFLYNNGKYGPLLLGEDVDVCGDVDIEGADASGLKTIGVICSNRVAGKFPMPDGDDRDSDSALGYRHYAMGLDHVTVGGYDENFFNQGNESFAFLTDAKRFKSYNELRTEENRYSPSFAYFRNRNGRLYTRHLLNGADAGYREVSFASVLNEIERMNGIDHSRVSAAFIPASGNLHDVVCNLFVLFFLENSWGAHYIMPQSKSVDGDNRLIGVRWGASSSYRELNTVEALNIHEYFNYFTRLKSYDGFFEMNGQPLFCCNADKGGFYIMSYKEKCEGSKGQDFVSLRYSAETMSGDKLFTLVPFYAVTSYGLKCEEPDRVDGGSILPGGNDWTGWIE